MSFGIPDGELYHNNPLSAGTVASPFEPTAVNTEHAGAEIAYGGAVNLKDGKAIPATNGQSFYGVALKRTSVHGFELTEEAIEGDKWKEGETLGVLRDGTVFVPISEDVDRGESATVDANGTFKPAAANDAVVGIFTSSGNAGSTAELQTRVQFAAVTEPSQSKSE